MPPSNTDCTHDTIRDLKHLPPLQATKSLIGRRVNKHFGHHGWHHGTVKSEGDLFRIAYDDGDEEDLTREELDNIIIKPRSPMPRHIPTRFLAASTAAAASLRRSASLRDGAFFPRE